MIIPKINIDLPQQREYIEESITSNLNNLINDYSNDILHINVKRSLNDLKWFLERYLANQNIQSDNIKIDYYFDTNEKINFIVNLNYIENYQIVKYKNRENLSNDELLITLPHNIKYILKDIFKKYEI